MRAAEQTDMGWMDYAACKGKPDLFFPHPAQPADEAIAICAGCDVRAECARFARNTGQEFGIWGGMRIGGAGKIHDRRMAQAERVLSVLDRHAGMTTGDVCRATELKRDIALRALRLLLDTGAVVRQDRWQEPTLWRRK